MTEAAVKQLPVRQRAVYGTCKYRAGELAPGDVTRNSYGKWGVVTKVVIDGLYASIHFDTGTAKVTRDVDLVDVQIVKPS